MSVVNSVVVCTSKHMKKINLTLNGLTTHRDKKKKTGKRLDMFGTLIVVMVSWMDAHIQTHQDMYIECVQILFINSASVKLKKFSAKTKASRSSPVNRQLVFYSTRPFEGPYEIYFRTVYAQGRWGNHVSIYPLVSVTCSSEDNSEYLP